MRQARDDSLWIQNIHWRCLGGIWIHRGRSWLDVSGSQSSLSHDISFNDNSKHTQSFSSHPKAAKKRVGRGEDFKIYYIREEFPLGRAVTQKKRGEKKKRRQKDLSSFTKFVGCFFFLMPCSCWEGAG